MNNRYVSLILFLSIILLSLPLVSANGEDRGVYVYDEANKIATESELGLNAYLWKIDVKSGYEMVVVFPTEKLTVEQMADWFNKHGVGKKDKDNGLALFVFPDNTAYGMIGREHDRIAVPYVSTYGKRTLSNLKEEPVLAILSFLSVMNKKIDEPTVTEQTISVGKFIVKNLDIIILGLLILSLIILLYEQKDGFQVEDLYIPCGLFIIFLVILGITYVGSEIRDNSHQEYGMISSTKLDSHMVTETKCSGSGKSRTCRTEFHTIYTNDVSIKSYDFRIYKYRFSSRDSKSSWNIKVDDKISMRVSTDNELLWASTNIDDNSGGKTDMYGTWIQTK